MAIQKCFTFLKRLLKYQNMKGGSGSIMKEQSEDDNTGFDFTPMTKERSKDRRIENRTKTKEIPLESLVPFSNHPFKLYEGQRFIDMVESIKAIGVQQPIVVRPIAKEEKFEILSGHNRVEAAKAAGFKTIPGVIREGLTDDDVLLIVTETNLIQRSFADLMHSERAIALAITYDAMKKKSGYRSDLLQEIDEVTSAPVGRRLQTRDSVGEKYGLSKNTVARYLRVNKLIPEFKERLDNDMIGMRVAEALSYLRVNEQKIVDELLASDMKISIKQADTLKAESENRKLDKAYIKSVFVLGFYAAKFKPVKLSGQFLSKHFTESQSTEEIESVINQALELYFSSRSR